jgi:MSHA biogenesis protein MshP
MSAIFILVVLASLGAYVVTISSAQHIGSALDIQGSRALQTARAGMDWGIARAVNDPTHFGAGDCKAGPWPVSVNLNTAGTDFPSLAGYAVSVTCTGTVYSDGGVSNLYSYALTATACNQPNAGVCPNTATPGANYVERRLTAQVTCNATLPC